ncbi:hypothetical protein VTK26DRAFT_3192 [Humicola hyalothermophila]
MVMIPARPPRPGSPPPWPAPPARPACKSRRRRAPAAARTTTATAGARRRCRCGTAPSRAPPARSRPRSWPRSRRPRRRFRAGDGWVSVPVSVPASPPFGARARHDGIPVGRVDNGRPVILLLLLLVLCSGSGSGSGWGPKDRSFAFFARSSVGAAASTARAARWEREFCASAWQLGLVVCGLEVSDGSGVGCVYVLEVWAVRIRRRALDSVLKGEDGGRKEDWCQGTLRF